MKNNQKIKELVLLKDLGMILSNKESKTKRRHGLYKCFCGVEFRAQSHNVKRGHTQSCGCYQKKRASEVQSTHGLGKHRLYNVWNRMMGRCNNIRDTNYSYYGGRGISVSDRWLNIENFIRDMYPTFKEGLTLDRINNNKEYSKENCRWAKKTTQSRNISVVRKNNTSGYKGVSFQKNIKKWASRINVNYKKINLGNYEDKKEAAIAYDKYVDDNNLEHSKNFS